MGYHRKGAHYEKQKQKSKGKHNSFNTCVACNVLFSIG